MSPAPSRRWRIQCRKASHFFGRYEYLLAPHQDSWRIRKKKILVLNNLIPTVLDIYSV